MYLSRDRSLLSFRRRFGVATVYGHIIKFHVKQIAYDKIYIIRLQNMTDYYSYFIEIGHLKTLASLDNAIKVKDTFLIFFALWI